MRKAFRRSEPALAASEYERLWRTHLGVDLSLGELASTLLRNRHLQEVWLSSFYSMVLASQEDPRYARTAGGVLAGIVSPLEMLSPLLFLRTALPDPSAWSQVLGLGEARSLTDLLVLGARLSVLQIEMAGRLWRDRRWVADWAADVRTAQGRCLDALERRLQADHPSARVAGVEEDCAKAVFLRGAIRSGR